MDALKPCPFDGAEARLIEGHKDHWRAQCTKCGANIGDFFARRDAKEKAITAWNRRIDPRPAAQPGVVKRLEELAQRIDADGTASQIGSAEEIREILSALATPVSQEPVDRFEYNGEGFQFAPITEGEPSDAEVAYFDGLVERAKTSAAKASAKFPQPNYVALKIAEEAGEVVRGAVHYAENRMEWQEVEGEIVQLLAMLIRFVTEGDQINGITPPCLLAAKSKGGQADG